MLFAAPEVSACGQGRAGGGPASGNGWYRIGGGGDESPLKGEDSGRSLLT